MNQFEKFDTDLRECRKCESILEQKYLDERSSDERIQPRPIVIDIRPRPIMLIGQAPGLTEYQSRMPFQGPAGINIREVFAECGVSTENFARLVHTTAVVKCFPGSKKVANRKRLGFRREDEKPSVTMINNCRPLLERQIALADPKVIVLLGSFPLRSFLCMSGATSSKAELAAFVGRVLHWDKRAVVPFPHTSGSSFWLNHLTNRQLFEAAKSCLRAEVASLDEVEPIFSNTKK